MLGSILGPLGLAKGDIGIPPQSLKVSTDNRLQTMSFLCYRLVGRTPIVVKHMALLGFYQSIRKTTISKVIRC